MAVFLAAADESDGAFQRGPFLFGGFVAPTDDWITWFAPAWEERVLNRHPPIPCLHMVDIRSARWREENGLTWDDAEHRVDEATRIIGSMGSLMPVRTLIDGGHFRDTFGETQIARLEPQPSVYQMEPDYIALTGFVYGALDYVAQEYPDAEQVDFVIERKTQVTHRMQHFYDSIPESLRQKGRGELVHLLGRLIPGHKKRVPLQAADVAVWHLRRHECRESDDADRRRLARMFDGRRMMVNGLTTEQVSGVGERSKLNSVPSPFKAKARFKPRGGA
jgi:hypothetical protein